MSGMLLEDAGRHAVGLVPEDEAAVGAEPGLAQIAGGVGGEVKTSLPRDGVAEVAPPCVDPEIDLVPVIEAGPANVPVVN